MESYYDLLGISKRATEKEIRQAYRKLARQYHPDVNPENKEAEETFKRINEANEVLSDPETRRKYDQYGSNWKYADQMPPKWQTQDFGQGERWQRRSAEGPFGSIFDLGDLSTGDLLGDLFSSFRGTHSSSSPVSVEVTLEEAYNGTTRLIEIREDSPGAPPHRLEVKIPPGVNNGSKIRISSEHGNLREIILKVSVRPHPSFKRKGADLYTEIAVPLADAVLGGEASVPTLNGQVMLTLKPETQNQQLIRLAGKGMPHLDRFNVKGDLYAKVEITLPNNITEKERELFQELRELRTPRR